MSNFQFPKHQYPPISSQRCVKYFFFQSLVVPGNSRNILFRMTMNCLSQFYQYLLILKLKGRYCRTPPSLFWELWGFLDVLRWVFNIFACSNLGSWRQPSVCGCTGHPDWPSVSHNVSVSLQERKKTFKKWQIDFRLFVFKRHLSGQAGVGWYMRVESVTVCWTSNTELCST